MAINWRTICMPDSLFRVSEGSFDLRNIQMASGSSVANFIRATGLIAQRWSGQLDFAPMAQAQWQEWKAWRARLSGQAVLFNLRAPMQRLPLGAGAGYAEDNPAFTITGITITGVSILTGATTALVHEQAARYARTLLVDFGVAMAGQTVMTHGDLFGHGGNLYVCTGESVADASGIARLVFRAGLHRAALEGDIVNLRDPTCRVMLRDANGAIVQNDSAGIGRSGFEFIEVPFTQ